MTEVRKLTPEEITFLEREYSGKGPGAGTGKRGRPKGSRNTSDIFGTRFTAERVPIWNQFGKRVEPGLTVSEAFAAHGLNYEVGLRPTFAEVNPGQFVATGRAAVVRSPMTGDDQARIFSDVSKNFKFLQNAELAELLNPIAEQWPVDTVGATRYGETVFVILNAGAAEIAGESYGNYFLVTDSKSGGRALTVAFVTLRHECTNAIPFMLAGSLLKTSIPHRMTAFQAESQFRLSFMHGLRQIQSDAVRSLESLTRRSLAEEEVAGIINAAYPDPPRTGRKALADAATGDTRAAMDEGTQTILREAEEKYQAALENVNDYRNGARTLLGRFNEAHQDIANTPYAVFQVIVESADFRRGKDGASAESALWGPRAAEKSRALSAALALV